MTYVYRYYDKPGRLLYVGIAEDWRSRLKTHRYGPWFRLADSVVYEWFGTRGEAKAAETEAIRSEWPLWNIDESPYRVVAWALGDEHRRAHPIREYRRCYGAAETSRTAAVWRRIHEGVRHEYAVVRSARPMADTLPRPSRTEAA